MTGRAAIPCVATLLFAAGCADGLKPADPSIAGYAIFVATPGEGFVKVADSTTTPRVQPSNCPLLLQPKADAPNADIRFIKPDDVLENRLLFVFNAPDGIEGYNVLYNSGQLISLEGAGTATTTSGGGQMKYTAPPDTVVTMQQVSMVHLPQSIFLYEVTADFTDGPSFFIDPVHIGPPSAFCEAITLPAPNP